MGLSTRVITIALTLSLSGCATIEYLTQAACGQVDLGMRSRRLDAVVSDSATPAAVRALLAEVPAIKTFAERQGLKPTANYRSYADLHRSAAVWIVGASAPLSFTPRIWTFPVVGSVPYLGYFEKDDASALAKDLSVEGYDVDIRGASAYSTLGWFDDPILSTMLGGGDEAVGDLANVVLHESVHTTFYVPGQSALNESVADFLGNRLAAAYLREKVGEDSTELRAYLEAARERDRHAAAFHAAHVELAALYGSAKSRQDKLAAKANILRRLRAAVDFPRPINNATLSGYETYNSGKVELDELYEVCGHKASRLLASLRELGPGSFSKPHQQDLARVLAPLVRRARRSTPAPRETPLAARR